MAYVNFPPGGGVVAESILGAAGATISVNIPGSGVYEAVLTCTAAAAGGLTCTMGGDAPAQRGADLLEGDGTALGVAGAIGPGVVSIEGTINRFTIKVVAGQPRVVSWVTAGDVGATAERLYNGVATWTETTTPADFTLAAGSNMAAGAKLTLRRLQ